MLLQDHCICCYVIRIVCFSDNFFYAFNFLKICISMQTMTCNIVCQNWQSIISRANNILKNQSKRNGIFQYHFLSYYNLIRYLTTPGTTRPSSIVDVCECVCLCTYAMRPRNVVEQQKPIIYEGIFNQSHLFGGVWCGVRLLCNITQWPRSFCRIGGRRRTLVRTNWGTFKWRCINHTRKAFCVDG